MFRDNSLWLTLSSSKTNRLLHIQIEDSLAFHVHQAIHCGDVLLLTHCRISEERILVSTQNSSCLSIPFSSPPLNRFTLLPSSAPYPFLVKESMKLSCYEDTVVNCCSSSCLLLQSDVILVSNAWCFDAFCVGDRLRLENVHLISKLIEGRRVILACFVSSVWIQLRDE